MEKIKKILVGTNNEGKYKEICDLLPVSVKKYSPKELNIPSPEETGKSFKENSFIKASYFSKKTNQICLSDDSGLEIDLLNGKPGIYSSRWAGKKSNFDLAIKKVFEQMNNIKKNWKNENKARFICNMTLYWPDGQNFSSEGYIEGKISDVKKGKNGFGYDPIFLPNGSSKTFGEMTNKEKNFHSHRGIAINKLINFISN